MGFGVVFIIVGVILLFSLVSRVEERLDSQRVRGMEKTTMTGSE